MTVSPQRCANEISQILNQVFGKDRFPVNVGKVAREISHQKFPDAPITMVHGEALPGFEGALIPSPSGKNGWAILFNNDLTSLGRMNFTLAHEFGHYMLHRKEYPSGLHCTTEDMRRWDSEYHRIESEANLFAATLLMPLDDFRQQIDAQEYPDFTKLSDCASRYEVSLTAATLRWLEFTTRRSLLVASRDDFILWAKPSTNALRTGLFYRTRTASPTEVPASALAAQLKDSNRSNSSKEHDDSVWLETPCTENVLISEQYDLTLSLLHFDSGIT